MTRRVGTQDELPTGALDAIEFDFSGSFAEGSTSGIASVATSFTVARGADAFDVADQALVAAHAAMLADPNLGGLAIAVREIDCEWEFDDADAGAVALPARYEIRDRKSVV